MAAKKKIDYDRIEPAWRAGIKSPDQLAEDYTAATGVPVSRQAICKYFKGKGIPRDLGPKIQAKADALVAASMVADKVAAKMVATETAIINAGAVAVVGIKLSHRAGLETLSKLKEKLLKHTEEIVDALPDLGDVIEMVRKPDGNGVDKANNSLRRAMGRSAVIDDLKKLAEIDEKVRKGEREAYSIDSLPPPPPEGAMHTLTTAELMAIARGG